MAAIVSDVHTVGSKVWVRDGQESWLKGDVIDASDGDWLIVKTEHGDQRKVKADDCPLQNQESRGAEVRLC